MADVELLQGGGNVTLDGIRGDVHVVCNLLIGPAPGRQHGGGELRSGEIISYVVACDRVMDSAPSRREPVCDVDNPLEILRPRRLDDCF